MRRWGNRDREDMYVFEQFICHKVVHLRRYRGLLSVMVTGCLSTSIVLSFVQLLGYVVDFGWIGVLVAGWASLALPWAVTSFATCCAWWCLLPPADPDAYIANLNGGMRFLNIKFDEKALQLRLVPSADAATTAAAAAAAGAGGSGGSGGGGPWPAVGASGGSGGGGGGGGGVAGGVSAVAAAGGGGVQYQRLVSRTGSSTSRPSTPPPSPTTDMPPAAPLPRAHFQILDPPLFPLQQRHSL
eukprot:Rhum_TRINITY_DN14076_c3_g1::Rhum_TRINITY_DN14076_c3_g1_i2::g.68545::m.68545